MLSLPISEIKICILHEDISPVQLIYIRHLVQYVSEVGNILVILLQMISIETIISLMKELIKVKSINAVTIHIYRIDDTKFNLINLSNLIKNLRVLFQSLSTPINFVDDDDYISMSGILF